MFKAEPDDDDWQEIDFETFEEEVAESDDTEGEVISPGIYIAKTAIQCRSEADVDAAFTGELIKPGEAFEVTETVPTNRDGLAYLRVGNRGWIFDLGIAREWAGLPIVVKVEDPLAKSLTKILRNPGRYAEYQASLSDLDYDSDEENPPSLDVETDSAQNDALWMEIQRTIQADGAMTSEDKEAFEELSSNQEERDLVLSSLREASGKAFATSVMPKWMRLAQLLAPEVQRQMEASKRHFTSLPDGDEGLEGRPTDCGRRMGIRLPSACTCS